MTNIVYDDQPSFGQAPCTLGRYDSAKLKKMEDFEIGVYDSELYYSGKLFEWLEFRRKQFEFYPNDHGSRYRFAEALIQNNMSKDALKYLQKFHEDDPEDEDFNQQILDCLRKLNLNKDDFKWRLKPNTLCLNQELEMKIWNKLKNKIKCRLNDIYLDVMIGNLLEFDEVELMNYLKKSQNFKVEGVEFYDAIVERI